MSAPVLRIRDLTVSFRRGGTTVPAVSGLDLTVPAGGAVGIVGESGSGKSVTSLAVLRLLPSTTQVTGSVEYGGRDLLTLTERQMRRVRGKEIS
ncbi:MAG TPA: ATP-binding cassette domain-containing protein, partial [Cellulomonas sp.]